MIPFVDLAAQHAPLAHELHGCLDSLLSSSGFILGRELELFEHAFARYLDVPHAVGVSSGTAALRLSCEALLTPGDEVIVPAHTYAASAIAVTQAGCRPRFVDVTADSGALDPGGLEAARTARTRAVLAVHMYGHPAPLASVLEFARRHDLRVIEDCAQAHGARYRGRRVGGFGDAGCFSFYPSKNLGALGDGGMVVTRDSGLAQQLRARRHLGQRVKNVHELPSQNDRLDGLQASFLRVKLPHLDGWNARRRWLADRYREELRGTDLVIPSPAPECEPVHHLFVIRHPSRDTIRECLEREEIGCGVYYPIPVPFQPCYASMGHARGSFPMAELLSRESLALPMFPELRDEQLQDVARAVRRSIGMSGF